MTIKGTLHTSKSTKGMNLEFLEGYAEYLFLSQHKVIIVDMV